MGTRLLADRDEPGRYTIVAALDVIDTDLSAADQAARSNERPEPKTLAARLHEMVGGEPEYRDHDELYRADQ